MSCKSGKVPYETDEEAWLAAYDVFKKYNQDQKPYLCIHCGDYHLTTRSVRLPNWLIKRIKN